MVLAELYLPLPQSVHPEAVLEGAYLPGPQVEQVVSAAFWLLYFPFVQAMHWVAPLLLFVRCPLPHVMQSYAVLGLAELYFPLGQSVHPEAGQVRES